MIHIEFFALLASFFVMFLWNRSESRRDFRNMENKIDSYRVDTFSMIRSIQEEMKDFHDKLYAIEKSRNNFKK